MEESSYGVCRLSLVSVRKTPDDYGQLVTQLLFGDHYEVLKQEEQWVFIRIHFEKIEGWIAREQHHEITREYFEQINYANYKITTDLTSTILYKKSPLTILMGSVVPISNSELFKIEEQFAFNGESKSLGQKREFEFLKTTALKYLNAPTLAGGKSPFGIDAAGLVFMTFKLAGYSLSRTFAYLQKDGREIKEFSDAKPGDLAFFKLRNNKVGHVGIVLEDGKIIHSDGKVRVDYLMEEGILRAESKVYTHTLSEVRRVINY